METKYIEKEISILARMEELQVISQRGLDKLKEFRYLRDLAKRQKLPIHDVIKSSFLCDRECSSENKCDEQCYMCSDMEKHSVYRRELLLAAICEYNKFNTRKDIKAVDDWLEKWDLSN